MSSKIKSKRSKKAEKPSQKSPRSKNDESKINGEGRTRKDKQLMSEYVWHCVSCMRGYVNFTCKSKHFY